MIIKAAQAGGTGVCDCHVGDDFVLLRTGSRSARQPHLVARADGTRVGSMDVDARTSFTACGRYFLAFEQSPTEALSVLVVDEAGESPLRTVAGFALPYRKSRRALDTKRGLFVGLYADTALAEGVVLWLRVTEDGGMEEVMTIANPYPDKQDQFGEDLALHENYLYVLAPLDDTLAHNIGTIYVYDVSSASAAGQPLSGLSDWTSGAKRLLVRAPYLYVSHRDGSISVFDISDPTGIKPVSSLKPGRDPLWWGGFGFVDGNVAFADSGNRLVVVDSDPDSGTFGGELTSKPFGSGLEALPFRVSSSRDGLAVALFSEDGQFEELRIY